MNSIQRTIDLLDEEEEEEEEADQVVNEDTPTPDGVVLQFGNILNDSQRRHVEANAIIVEILSHLICITTLPMHTFPAVDQDVVVERDLTIANDRASLLPGMAEDLIFLHDGLPIYQAFHGHV